MTIEYIAAIIESTYNNGRVFINDKKMDFDDFLQISRAINGDIMRRMWYEERQVGDASLYFAGSITTEIFPIVKARRFRTFKFDEGGAVKLPYSMGVMRVAPLISTANDDGEECDDTFDEGDVFHKGVPGMEYSYGSADMLDDLGEAFYVLIGNGGRLFGFPDATSVEVDYIKNDEELDVPEGVAWQIINTALGPVLKVAGYPVDPTSNGNPNVQTIKNRLDNPQTV